MTISIFDIKTEILAALRNSDLISTTTRGVTTSTDTGTFTAATTHTLTTNPTLLKNIRSITIDGAPLDFGEDYTLNYATGVINFIAAQTGAYTIIYDEGSQDKIYPDYPQPFLKNKDFPRIGFDIISGTSNEFGIGAAVTQSEYLISITVYAEKQDDVENMIAGIRALLIANKKSFYYLPFVTVTSMGPLLVTPFGMNKIMQRNQDFTVKFVFE